MTKTDRKLTCPPRGGSTEKSVMVRMSQVEYNAIKTNAENAGFKRKINSGVSSYMRELALGYKPKSHIDRAALNELTQLRLNLVQIGNLFRLALVKDRDRQRWYAELKKLYPIIHEIRELRDRLWYVQPK